MLPSNRIFSAFIILLLAVIACNMAEIPVSAIPTLEPDAISTLIQGTVAGALTQSAAAPISLVTPAATETATATFTPEPPTFTPTVTLTPTFAFTPTASVPFISVSVATNCRNGPGKVYGYEGALLVGESAQIFASDPSGNYWFIRNPDSSGNDYCWLWGNYATITGNISILPIYTPPPTPTPTFTPTPAPSFIASYSNLDKCKAEWWLDLRIKNNGSVSFKSFEIALRDMATGVMLVDLSDGFIDLGGCVRSSTQSVIAPGGTYLLSAPSFDYDPTGHNIRITLTLCSEPGQKGNCLSDHFSIMP